MSNRIRKRMSGDRRRGSLKNLVRTRVGPTLPPFAPVSTISVYRLCRLVGARNADASLSGYATPWTNWADVGGALAVGIASGEAPQIAASGGTGAQWIRLCRPIRYRAGAPESSAILQTRAAESQLSSIANSDTLVPDGSHCGPLIVSALSLPIPVLARNDEFINDRGNRVTHLRVLRNGTDISGIVSLSPGQPFTNFDIGSASPGFPFVPGNVLVPVTPFTAAPDDVIEWDIFIRAQVSDAAFLSVWPSRAILRPWPGSYSHYNGNLEPVRILRIDGTNANAKIRKNTRWRLTVPDASEYLFGGTSRSLTLQPQAGWTYSETSISREMSHSFGDTVTLRWDREIPQIIIASPAIREAFFGTRKLRYQPFGTAYSDWTYGRHGVWNPQAPTNFSLQGSLIGTVGYTSAPPWLSVSRVLPFLAPYAQSITVERV